MGYHKPPGRILIVDVKSDVKDVSVKTPARTETLVSWHAQELQREGIKLKCAIAGIGSEPATFWELAEWEVSSGAEVWVVSWQCGRAWALLDLWGMLASGQARVAGNDYRAVYDPVTNARQSRPGMLVAEDPPNIVELRVGAHPGKLLWIDCRNWGVDLDASLERGSGVVGALSALVVRMDELSARYVGAPLAPTAAGHAWRAWRAGIALEGVHCHANQAALDLERAAHFGGRCEAFRIGKLPDKWFHLDFRSHYGAIMAQEHCPTRLIEHAVLDKYNGLQNLPASHCTIAKITVETDEPAYPLLRENYLIYPVGTFVTTLCGPELADAVDRGRVKAWHEIATYEMSPVLREYAQRIYVVRELAGATKNCEVGQWAKSLINSLPGKLGYRFRCWETQPLQIAPEPNCEWHSPDECGKLIRWRAIGGVCQREIIGGYGPDAVPAMAAWICSHGRKRLLDAIRCAGWEEVAYVDTDSLIVSWYGMLNLQRAGHVDVAKLGVLEVRTRAETTEIFGIKHYVEDGVIKCAGSPRGVTTVSSDGKSRWYTPAIAQDASRRRINGADSVLIGPPQVAVYRHGVVGKDGRVTPHRL